MDPQNAADVKAANALQDAIKAAQVSIGKFEVPSVPTRVGQLGGDGLL